MQVKLKLALLLALLLLVSSCLDQQHPPGLLQLTDLSTRELSAGDELRLLGAGFPEGRSARVTLRGDVFRPGAPPERDFELSFPAQTLTPHVLEAVVSEDVVTRLCGGPGVQRATFRGDIVAAFAPRKSGAAPVTGALEGVVLDLESSRVSALERDQAASEGQRFASFLGIELAHGSTGALRIAKLQDGSRAQEVGLQPGDLLEELSGVRLRSLADFVPPPRASMARVGLRRAGHQSATVAVEIAGFRPGVLSDLVPALSLLGGLTLLLLLAISPLGRCFAWFELKLAQRARELRSPSRTSPARALVHGVATALPSAAGAHAGVALGSSLLALSAFGVTLVARELDLLLLLLMGGTALCCAASLTGPRNEQGLVKLASAAYRGLLAALLQLPIAAALMVSALDAGSLRVDDLSEAQAGAFWNYSAFRSPLHFAAFAAGVLSLIPEVGTASDSAGRARRWPALAVVEWAQLVLAAGVLSIALLGGTSLTGASELARGSGVEQLIGTVVLVTKTLVLVLVVSVGRFALGSVRLEACEALLFKAALPISVLLPLLTRLWTLAAESALLATYRSAAALALCAAAAAALLLFVRRMAQRLRAPRPEFGINPWI
jgi:hypothetical protein